MSKNPTTKATWNRATSYKKERISNLVRAIPSNYNRIKNATNTNDTAEVAELKNHLSQMLTALSRLSPNHPHLNEYTLENI